MTDLIFVDIETTGTEHWAKVWEIAAITLDGDSWHAAWQPPLNGADLESLRANRLVDRYAAGEVHDRAPSEQIAEFAAWVRNRGDHDGPPTFAGAGVHAILAHLQRFAGKASRSVDGGCHLRVTPYLVDVGTYAAGVFCADPPLSLLHAAAVADVGHDAGRLHLPLHRAWLAREVYGNAYAALHGTVPDSWRDVENDDGRLSKVFA